ncbi:bifunctional hydroxymethylpyrimidine kinase/phosphomethylpyrimidine kinase [Dellaglioa algida]|nr:bifunctional hydroxymethylpyrimidine kinase/phosphomethylpyrimidine kinase [Dellaglioa algida]MDK1718760.1 bifunctional hydroxymethylpyrimidine kinase/phosphomethylpyrimidine kinase [Dellaglioa algida]MDK1730333.1 bifunctional hydroxymethylpyrimidine kinase/phosphomethylpyrimidine kinase [Dellaglioa algida]MDK1742767.1 bifunctional hydroxymethylpyrimidine kinase/phosphomethylpyrimidine kinase [Dellaglioa algida]
MMTDFPQALSIAGSDSSGGAGMQADLKTMQERHVYAATVLVAITAQNTIGVQDSLPLPAKIINEQFTSIADDLAIKACKTGMLADSEHVSIVVENLKKYDFGPLIVDPVMVAKGGATLLTEDAVITIKENLVPLATVVTPNIPEAEVLTGLTINSKEDMIMAGKKMKALGAKNVIIKGGHQNSANTASDFVLLENGHSFWLSSKRIDTIRTHGTGDTLSACIAAELAKGADVETAIITAKKYVEATIADGIIVGHGHGPLNHWAYREVAKNAKL